MTTTATRTCQNQRSRTIAVHMRYKSVCISLPSPAKQQHKMTKFFVVWGTRRTMAKISHFQLRLNAVVTCLILNKGVLNRSRHDNCEIHRWNINSIVIRRCPWICNSDKIWFHSRKTQIFSFLRFFILKKCYEIVRNIAGGISEAFLATSKLSQPFSPSRACFELNVKVRHVILEW